MLLVMAGCAGAVPAQEPFTPPEDVDAGRGAGIRLGLFGFGGAVGVDLSGDPDVVLAYALDVGDFFTQRVRLRSLLELGLDGARNDYVGNVELIYRFTPDSSIAIPYVGAGFAVQGHETCSSDPNCPNLWVQFALGFEVALRESFNWMVEYRGEDALTRHRLLAGFTTRRGRP